MTSINDNNMITSVHYIERRSVTIMIHWLMQKWVVDVIMDIVKLYYTDNAFNSTLVNAPEG